MNVCHQEKAGIIFMIVKCMLHNIPAMGAGAVSDSAGTTV